VADFHLLFFASFLAHPELGHFQTSADATAMSAFLPLATTERTSLEVRKVPIVLQKSKIGRHPKSRESRILGDSAAAMLCGADTKLRGRFSDERWGPSHLFARNASAVL